jgi:uncharacterized protein (DUF2267 family)
MATGTIDTIERTVQKTNEWVRELDSELGGDDQRKAWRVLRGYFHVLRDRLTIDEGAQLAAQFPHLLRGVYYEGFDPGHQPEPIRDRDTFLARFAERAEIDPGEAPAAAVAGTNVLRRHVSAGELDDVAAQLPTEIRQALQLL